MKGYLLVTGGLFGLVGVAHLARLFVERDQASDVSFLAINLGLFVVGVGVAVWAWLLLRGLRSVAP